MSSDIKLEGFACISQHIDVSTQLLDVVWRWHDVIALVDEIFRANVNEPQKQRRHPWHRIVKMRNAEIPTGILVGDKVAEFPASDTWCSKGVQICWNPHLPNLSGGNVCDGATETVPCNNNFGSGILSCCGFQGGQNTDPGFKPRIPDTLVSFTVVTNIGRDLDEVGICKEVADCV